MVEYAGVDLSKMLGGQTLIWGEAQKLVITDESMGVSQVFGEGARPPQMVFGEICLKNKYKRASHTIVASASNYLYKHSLHT